MIEDKKVSIILCFYNEEKYLKQAIDSVLAQTYHNFELIIINDGSNDGSNAIVKGYSDERIVYRINSTNKRLAYCRNRGLELASGDYIGFFDADDIMMSDKIEKQVEYLNKNEDITILSGGYRYMDAEGNLTSEVIRPQYKTNKEIRAYMLYMNCIACAGAALFRRELIDKYDVRFDEHNLASEDYRFWIDMLPYAEFTNVDDCFFYYRINHGSKANNIVKQDKGIYNAEIIRLLEHAWGQRGFLLSRNDFVFMHTFLYKRKRIWKLSDVYHGLVLYKKVRYQLSNLLLPEGELILKYYRQQWMQSYHIYWLLKKITGR